MRSRDLFNCTDRDRAVFEAGIKLASLYHQYIGSPVNPENAGHFETAMEEGMKAQPFVSTASVSVDRRILKASLSPYGYCSLNERMLEAKVEIEYEGWRVRASLGWVEELSYPLMKIDDIKKPAK